MNATSGVYQPQPKASTIVGIGVALLSMLTAGCLLLKPAERQVKAEEPASAEVCKHTFDALVADTITSIDPDEAGACGVHFASWAKSIPDTVYAVKGGILEVRGGSFPLRGAQFWRTSYSIGNERLPAVLVVTETTAATLRFQKASDADAAFAAVAAGAKSN